MNNSLDKPRLVYFQWNHGNLPKFLQTHANLHVKCLSEFFEVILINKDCDYQQVCEAYLPDLALFESGYRSSISQRIRVKNTSACPQVPKVGFHNGDSWCDCRVGFLSDMEEWGIKTFFSISTTMAEHTPEIADNLFIWPNFIDSEIYHDYGRIKNIPIMFSGHITSLYPWRQEVYDVVSKRFPCLTYPHLGYEDQSSLMIHGKQYAEAMNAAWFVPTCGTLAMEVVRKHFEIPGSKSCLVTQESDSLLAAGFRDMENCVFATPSDINGKLGYLFENRKELKKIINAGYDLVHTKHTLRQRSQIYDWYVLNKKIRANQKIIQENPFGALELVNTSDFGSVKYIKGNGINLDLLSQADAKMKEASLDEAEALYAKCLDLIYWMPEPKLKIAICYLLKGRPDRAYEYLIEPIENNLGKYKAAQPDPVEWAYLIICLLCKGDLLSSAVRARQFQGINHPELNRARWLVNFIQGKISKAPPDDNHVRTSSRTLHKLQKLSFITWIEHVQRMLQACGQYEISHKLDQASQPEITSQASPQKGRSKLKTTHFAIKIRVNLISNLDAAFENMGVPRRRTGLPSASMLDLLIRLGKWCKLNKMPIRLKWTGA
jgi:tetratricopeptide (TPR) repeat protein